MGAHDGHTIYKEASYQWKLLSATVQAQLAALALVLYAPRKTDKNGIKYIPTTNTLTLLTYPVKPCNCAA